MSEQAQANGTATTAKAPPPKRTRPSRAKAARTNGAAKPEAETIQQGAEARTEGQGADRGTAGHEAASEEARQQEESVRLEAERQEAAAREAAAREAAEKEAARVRQLLANYQTLMSAASTCLNNASAAMAEISATLTWEPENFGTVHLAIQKAERGLAEFRVYLTQARGLGAEQHLRAPDADLGECLNLAINANSELRRRLDAQISIMSTDVCNVPALLALERSISEQGMVATLMNRGLGRLLVQVGLAR